MTQPAHIPAFWDASYDTLLQWCGEWFEAIDKGTDLPTKTWHDPTTASGWVANPRDIREAGAVHRALLACLMRRAIEDVPPEVTVFLLAEAVVMGSGTQMQLHWTVAAGDKEPDEDAVVQVKNHRHDVAVTITDATRRQDPFIARLIEASIRVCDGEWNDVSEPLLDILVARNRWQSLDMTDATLMDWLDDIGRPQMEAYRLTQVMPPATGGVARKPRL